MVLPSQRGCGWLVARPTGFLQNCGNSIPRMGRHGRDSGHRKPPKNSSEETPWRAN
jgi:hypothetical protein